MGDIVTNDFKLSADTIVNGGTRVVSVAADGELHSNSTIQNNDAIYVQARGEVTATGTITNSSDGTMLFNQLPSSGPAPTGTSYLTSGNDTIVNNGQIIVQEGSTEIRGNVSGAGVIALTDKAKQHGNSSR